MIDKTIEDLEARIRAASKLSPGQKKELEVLVANLKKEVTQLSRTHEAAADSIAAFAGLTAREALKTPQNPKLMRIALDGIRASVETFEKTHPALTLNVNAISTFFSNIGI